MKKDKFYYAYIRMLIEQSQSLMEAENWWPDSERALDAANTLAHHGMSSNDIHSHLIDRLGRHYQTTAFLDWYKFGSSPPTVQYVRQVAKNYVGENHPTKTRNLDIEGREVHQNLAHPSSVKLMKNIHEFTQEHLPEHIKEMTVYRGIHQPTEHEKTYTPHSLESWSSSREEAEKFMKLGIKEGHIQTLYKATVPRHGILMSHLAPHAFRPNEDKLYGKEEQTVFGHTLKNIERLK